MHYFRVLFLLLLLFTKHFYHVVKGSISHHSLTSLFFLSRYGDISLDIISKKKVCHIVCAIMRNVNPINHSSWPSLGHVGSCYPHPVDTLIYHLYPHHHPHHHHRHLHLHLHTHHQSPIIMIITCLCVCFVGKKMLSWILVKMEISLEGRKPIVLYKLCSKFKCG